MNATESALADALRERRALIGDEASRRDPARHMEKLRAVSETIVALSGALPAPVDARLAHYLERCSYDKALEALESC
jgi:hypothetical protein